MKTLKIGFILLGLFVSPILFSQTNKAISYLDNMQKKYKSLAGFTASFSLAADGSTINGSISVKGNSYKLNLGGQEIFNNGVEVSTYFKELNEVTISAYDPSEDELSPAKIYSIDKSQFNISLVKEDATTAQVQLIPKKSATVSKIVLTIEKSSHFVKSWTVTEKSGKKQLFKLTKMNTQVKFGPESFKFSTKSHPGVEVNDLR